MFSLLISTEKHYLAVTFSREEEEIPRTEGRGDSERNIRGGESGVSGRSPERSR
jgi:hypothetical protein